MYALYDAGDTQRGQTGKAWRCFAANNTDSAHTKYTGGHCYCTREVLETLACACDPTNCPTPPPAPPPAPPAPPLPLANSTSVVFDSRYTPKGARANVTCYRIPSIEQTPDG